MSHISGKRILIVEDDTDIITVISAIVEEMGAEVFVAYDGEDALDLIRSQVVDLVLSDLVMPKVSGLALLQLLREENNEVPFVFITGCPSDESARMAHSLGASDYITKPFMKAEIIDVVYKALGGIKSL